MIGCGQSVRRNLADIPGDGCAGIDPADLPGTPSSTASTNTCSRRAPADREDLRLNLQNPPHSLDLPIFRLLLVHLWVAWTSTFSCIEADHALYAVGVAVLLAAGKRNRTI